MNELPSLQSERELLVGVASEAAELALRYFRAEDLNVWTKGLNSPVSDADIAVDRLLRERLLAARPGYGFLSEESVDDGSRLTAPRTFVVDPVDGTRAFVSGATDWTILIALVEAGRPIASAVIAPARGETYSAALGEGAERNGKAIRVSKRRDLAGAKLAVSPRLLRSVPASLGVKSVFYASLAYRLARIADGRLDGAAIKPNAQDWDLAAVDLLVHEAGGRLVNIDGSPPRYDRPETGHGAMVAGPPALCAELIRLAEAALAGNA